MKFLTLLFLLLSSHVFGQYEIENSPIKSGEYGELNIAIDGFMKRITGFYENYSGWDEEKKGPKFSCIFYLEGKLENDKAEIKTYYPLEKQDVKWGLFQQSDSNSVSIKLFEEHGGCWNVQHFADEKVNFTLDNPTDWIQVRFADKDKVFIYSDYEATNIQKSYIVKGDIVFVDEIRNTSAHCTYFGKKKKSGWIKIEDLNKLD